MVFDEAIAKLLIVISIWVTMVKSFPGKNLKPTRILLIKTAFRYREIVSTSW